MGCLPATRGVNTVLSHADCALAPPPFRTQLVPTVLLHSLPELISVELHLQGADIEAVLRELFNRTADSDAFTDRKRVWADLVLRQSAGPVALDDDVALPHARTAGVSRIVMIAGRHPTGVAFDQAHRQVRLIFMVLTPKERPAEYLQLVASLARRLRDPEVRKKLLNTQDPAEFAAALRS